MTNPTRGTAWDPAGLSVRVRDAQITLAVVDEAMLSCLVDVAVSDAAASDVTPPLTEGDSWTPERVNWLRQYHRACRGGLTESSAEAAWAVVVDGTAIGAVRLQRCNRPGTFEVGIWLAGRARGRQFSLPILRLVVALAQRSGAEALVANTTQDNLAAQALLKRAGFLIREDGNGIHAVLALTSDGHADPGS